MLVLKLDKIIDGTKEIKHTNMKGLSILSKICIQNVSSVIILCSIII